MKRRAPHILATALLALVFSEQGWSLEIERRAAAQSDNGPLTHTKAGPNASPSERVAASLHDASLRSLVAEVLERNPRLAAARAAAAAADQRAPQAHSLPDPMAGLTLFLATPETRVGPQQAAASLSQKLPWFGKLRLREQAALLDAAAAYAAVEAQRLTLVTETRRLYYEFAFLDEQARVVREDLSTLQHYEELAQARYASGIGLAQAVIKIQAEITRDQTRLLAIEERRATVVAALNALRDRQESLPVRAGTLPRAGRPDLPREELRAHALANRHELVAADLEIESFATRVELAQKDFKPDLTVGLSYTLVGRRDDPAGRLNPPHGNGDDILGISGSVNLPIWRERLAAGIEEAVERRLAAEERRRAVVAQIDGRISDLAARLPLLFDQLRLYDDVLTAQAEQSLLSAEAAYAAGNLGALDLLDAERVLLTVRIGAERVRADHAIAAAELEGEIAAPLNTSNEDR